MAFINIANQTPPSTPAAGTITLFPHSIDKNLYIMDESGNISRLDSLLASIVAAVSVTANATTVIVGGNNATAAAKALIPANTVKVGASFRVTILGSFTGTATATAFRIHYGTAGTSADTIIQTSSVTGAVGTSLARVDLTMTIRTIGATATCSGYMEVGQHANASVGVANTPYSVINATAQAFNTTVDSYLTVSVLSAASGSSGTVQNAVIERI